MPRAASYLDARVPALFELVAGDARVDHGRFAEHGVAREPELGFQGVHRVAPGGGPSSSSRETRTNSPTVSASRPTRRSCDERGNVWVTGPGGVWVLDPSGELLGVVRVPEVAANLAWGGEDWRTLFVTAGSGLYAVPTLVGPRREPFMGRVS